MEPVDDGEQDQPQVSETRRLILLALFLALLRNTRQKLQALVRSYLLVSVHTEDLSEGLITILTDAHAMAVSLGQQLAGQDGANTQRNRHAAIAVMVGQTGYLSNLVHGLRAGRYPLVDGALSVALLARLMLYVGVLRATANETWVSSLPPQTMVNWVLGAVRNHCELCPEYAANSPYVASEMTVFPAGGDCPCLGNCACSLETVGGDSGFELPEGDDLE